MLLSFLLLLVLFVGTGISIYQINNSSLDYSNDMLPGASVLGFFFVTFSLWVGFLFIGFIIASIGFFSSLINAKIATKPLVAKVSSVFLYVYSVVLVFLIGMAVYCAVKII